MPSPWPRRLGRLPDTILLHGLLLVLGSMSLCWNLAALVLHPLLPARTGRALGRAVIARCYRAFWWLASTVGLLRVDAGCLDALREARGLIVVANHPSMLDALLLVSRLPRSACIMKSTLMKNIFLGAGARLARYIRNDSPHRLVRSAVADLRRGGQLVVFPEGTRTTAWPVNRFHPGITHIAKHAGAPIQTVFIHTDSPYLTKGWPLWRTPPLPIVVRLRLGACFDPADDSDALLRDLESYYREQLDAAEPRRSPPRGRSA